MNQVLRKPFQPKLLTIEPQGDHWSARGKKTALFQTCEAVFGALLQSKHRCWNINGEAYLLKLDGAFTQFKTYQELMMYLAIHHPRAWSAKNKQRFSSSLENGFLRAFHNAFKVGFIMLACLAAPARAQNFITSEFPISTTNATSLMKQDLAVISGGVTYCWQRVSGGKTAVFGRKTANDGTGGSEANWDFGGSEDVTDCRVVPRSGGFHGIAKKSSFSFGTAIYGDRFQDDMTRLYQLKQISQHSASITQHFLEAVPTPSSGLNMLYPIGFSSSELNEGVWMAFLNALQGRSTNDNRVVSDHTGNQVQGSMDTDGSENTSGLTNVVVCLRDENSGTLVSRRATNLNYVGAPFAVSGSTANSMNGLVRYLDDGMGYIWLEKNGSQYQLKAAKHSSTDGSAIISAKNLAIPAFGEAVTFDFRKKSGGLVFLVTEPGSPSRIAKYEFDTSFNMQGCKEYIDELDGSDSFAPVFKKLGSDFIAAYQKVFNGAYRLVGRGFGLTVSCPTMAPTPQPTTVPTTAPITTAQPTPVPTPVPTPANSPPTPVPTPSISPVTVPTPVPTPSVSPVAVPTPVPTPADSSPTAQPVIPTEAPSPGSGVNPVPDEENTNLAVIIATVAAIAVCLVAVPLIFYLVWKKRKNNDTPTPSSSVTLQDRTNNPNSQYAGFPQTTVMYGDSAGHSAQPSASDVNSLPRAGVAKATEKKTISGTGGNINYGSLGAHPLPASAPKGTAVTNGQEALNYHGLPASPLPANYTSLPGDGTTPYDVVPDEAD